MANRIKIHSIFLLIIFMIIGSVCSYYYSDYKREQDYESYKVFLKKTFNGKSKLIDKDTKPLKYELTRHFSVPDVGLRVDENGDHVYETYVLKSGGWTVTELKSDYINKFEYNEYISQDMAFKIPKEKLKKHQRYSTLANEMFDIYEYASPPTNKRTVQEVYVKGLNYLMSKLGLENYVPDSREKIFSFFDKVSKFYSLKLAERFDTYDGAKNKARIYDTTSILWYKTSTETWRINFNKDKYYYFLGKNLIIGNIIAILLFLFWKYGRRIEFNR